MTYEEFRALWTDAVNQSGMPVQGFPTETLDLNRLTRHYEVRVEPFGGQDSKPFYVTAALSWRWSALQSARTATTEEDVVRELLVRERATTQKPWMRVDLKLSATLPWGEPMAMPAAPVWRAWVDETTARLERLQPLLSGKQVRTNRKGMLEFLAWQQGEPEVEASCGLDGALRIQGVHLSAWQGLLLPRQFSDSSRADPSPQREVGKLLARLKAALHAWSEALDHFKATR